MARHSKPSMPQDDREFLLKHALPPDARAPQFARTFSSSVRADLGRLGVTDEQLKYLERVLPDIVYYTKTPPSLNAIRKPLDDLAKAAKAMEKAARSILYAPKSDDVRTESRRHLLLRLVDRFPDRCPPLPRNPYDPRTEDGLHEAERLLDAIRDIGVVASAARKGLSTWQTRPHAHFVPIAMIFIALNGNGRKEFTASASANSPFRRIVSICYQAAGAPNTDPLRAIRAFVKGLHSRPRRKPGDVESGTRKVRGKRRQAGNRRITR